MESSRCRKPKSSRPSGCSLGSARYRTIRAFNPEDLQKELGETDPNTRLNLQQLLGSSGGEGDSAEQEDTPLLMKAAEHMAIRFALERYQKGEVKVNAVHQMMEHMSRQMDSLRQILKLQEDKMSKAGILVESHADILDRMFWAEVPESGKKSVLLSNEAPCVPPRNVRQFVEVLLERDDKHSLRRHSEQLLELPERERGGTAPQNRHRLEPTGGLVCAAGRRVDGTGHSQE